MTLVGRSVVRSTGYIGQPGYNIIHWTAGAGAGPGSEGGVEEFHDTLEAAFSSLEEIFAPAVEFVIEEQVVVFDDSDGVLIGATNDPSGDRTIESTGTGAQIDRSACATLRTRTGEFVNGRRLQGRIFLGPISAGIISNAGQIDTSVAANIEGAFSGAITGLGGRLCVWHRPTSPTLSDGSYGDVTSFLCNLTPGTLRSRKT